jgi:hypothetical protein
METFFNEFEVNVCEQFKIHALAKRQEIEEMLKRETEEKQGKLEAEAMKEWEAK